MSSRGASKRGAPEINSSNIKRTKAADDDDDDEIEEYFDDIENEEEIPSSTLPLLQIQEDASFPNDWKRKVCLEFCLEDDFIFQQIEIDVSSGKPHATMARGSDPNEAPHIRLFGITKEGNSVMTHVHGFMPYLYSDCPPISVANQRTHMWQQPMLPHGMPPQNQNLVVPQPPHDQSADSWRMRAQQWAQQRRVHNTVYPQQPPYPTGPPGETISPPPPPGPPGAQTEYMRPPPPPNYPPNNQDPHYRQYSPVPYSNYSHDHRQPPHPQHQHPPFQDSHTQSNPQTGQFESPDEYHHPPHLPQQSHWEHIEEPPHEYSPPSEPPPSPPPPHEYTYRYVPRHHYQQPYGRDRSEERTSPPLQLDNKEIELAAKRLLGDDSDSDSDNYNSNNRRKRVSEEDSLLTRRVYDPNHVYANNPSEQVSRLPQWSDTSPALTQQAPPVPLPAPEEQPPQSFDYGHGFPPPVRYHTSSQPPAASYFPSTEYSPAPAADYTQGEEDWAASRRVIPAWLRDDLKKLERNRQKQIEKETMEKNARAGKPWKESYDGTEMIGPTIPQNTTDKVRFFTSEDSRDKFLLEVLQMSVTEFLLEMTSAEIENVCSNALAEVRQSRAKPMVSYESSTESSLHEDELRDERKVSSINGQRARKSSHSSSPADRHSSRRSKHKSKSSRHHRRSETSSSRSRKQTDNSKSYRSRSRSPYSKSNRKHKSRH
ncbi:DNA polymerase delta catalytic subunit [Oopsacas minuta]|uniref:DNA polymerase delta catalytic subunit n=1 Tax=Oopsacas minuta TaxID=111878 RepID=A0AAV7JYN1_9METZ|nr:DNA polymerase delta catalytic subunit [Oopsacas minuta]